VTVTNAGARIYPHARAMAEEATRATAGASHAGAGTIRVSAPVTLAHLWLTAPLRSFLADRPEARVELLLDDRLVDPSPTQRLDVLERWRRLGVRGAAHRRARCPAAARQGERLGARPHSATRRNE
jgi:DNA-binding transcriptional LysR family regulator